jgi:hypothetical protein
VNWKRVLGYGVAVWLVPFAVAFVVFGLRDGNRALFESLITVTAVVSEVALAYYYLRRVPRDDGIGNAIVVGAAWAAISIVIDLPIFLLVFRMPLADYIADIAVSYLAIPAITAGMAAARATGAAPTR